MNLEYTDKVAIVTGAGEGIGYAIAEALIKKGARVILNDISEETVQKAVQKLQLLSPGLKICRTVTGDAGDLSMIEKLIATALAEFGRLDYVVANAGITTFGQFLDYPPKDFQKLIDLNLRGTFFLTQKAAREMIRSGTKGRILLMSSVTGYQAHPGLTAYGMTKAAIRALARLTGVELAPYGITVNAIAPGATLTERTMEDADYAQTWSGLNPTGHPNSPADIAEAALFLLSEKSSQITGQTIVIDGGWTATSPSPEEK